MAESTWLRAGTRAELEKAGGGLRVRLAGRWVAVLLDAGRVRAISDACPHRGASLASGIVDGGFVSCLDHGWEYHLVTGEGRCGFEGKVHVFEVDERPDGELWVLVGPPSHPAWPSGSVGDEADD